MRKSLILRVFTSAIGRCAAIALMTAASTSHSQAGQSLAVAPTPLVSAGHAADWVFVFKLNAGIFPSTAPVSARPCPFGGTASPYPAFSQQYAFAASDNPQLRDGAGLVGTSTSDPLGATFDEIYNGNYHFVVWNDQFYSHPAIAGCGDSCSGPWGHSKGILAWNDAGEGMILQVTTPSWPAAGSRRAPRQVDGDTLGCISDNDVKVSQDFFALKLSEPDVEAVLDALVNASVVTDPSNPQIVDNGGPAAIQAKVATLGRKVANATVLDVTLSSGVRLISKPSALHVPPWQMVSAELGGVPLRAATWWTSPAIPSTTASTRIDCWNSALGKPGAVEIATTGQWDGKTIGLKGGPGNDANHGKIAVSTAGDHAYTIFGDMNQQGKLSGNCASSQNGRGGLFFVIDNPTLHSSVQALIGG